MEFSEEWKSLWPISSVFSPPLLLSNCTDSHSELSSESKSNHEIGPLIFNPVPNSLTQLFVSPFLSPLLLPPPFPNLSLPRFLTVSSILPSTSHSIATNLGPQIDNNASPLYNCLQLLPCPGIESLLAFFPTGNNCDQVGYVILSVKDNTQLNVTVNNLNGDVFLANNKLNHRIVRLVVNPIDDCSYNSGNSYFTTIGYLLVCTMYSVYWYSVRIKGTQPVLTFLGNKLFKSSPVAFACWNPHLPEESVVLLESGELFLFDLDSCCRNKSTRFVGNRLRVSWKNWNFMEKDRWLSCEFSWHPRILIVANSSAVFLVDLRSEECTISCLLKIERLVRGNSVKNDEFITFSIAGSDGFYFAVATKHLLILCDVRKPLMPLLQWEHWLDDPRYITVFRLSELRSHSKDDKYKWASESGYCILMGSFWNCKFSLFCYGPDNGGSVASGMFKFCKSFYAWGLPSKFSLSGRECNCGSCLVREEFLKDTLLEWIDWRQKKEIVFGFGILNKDLSLQLSEVDSSGGFSLVRLMSSGKLESQRYCASWESVKISEAAHEKSSLDFEDSLLYAMGDCEYNIPEKLLYLKFDFLNGYLKDNLAEVMVRKLEKPRKGHCEKDLFRSDLHQQICHKLKTFGLKRLKSDPGVGNVFEDISLPTSIHEIALRSIWTGLPTDNLCLAFSTYSKLLEVIVNQKKVPLEFLDIPDQPHLPPFPFRKPSCRSSKWSQKVQPGNGLVGPVLPLHFLVTLHKLRMEKETDILSPDAELEDQCNRVMQVANEVIVSDIGSELHSDQVVSLADDTEEMCNGSQRAKLFSFHEPVAFSDKFSTLDLNSETSRCENKRFTTFIFKTHKEVVPNTRTEINSLELFNNQCPLELEFDDRAIDIGSNELKVYKLLKRQHLNFQESFPLYQEYVTRSNFQKLDP